MYYYNSLNFIEKACSELDYVSGDLITTLDYSNIEYTEKGEWIKLGESVNDTTHTTQKIFFVNHEPIIVFIKSSVSKELFKVYNKTWCMARPRLLFLEAENELYVFDLAKRPVKNDEELINEALAIVKNIVDIKSQLSAYHRIQIESGKIFEDEKFSNIEGRADLSLIRDLKIVRNKLISTGLSGKKLKYAHSLIGKSIFVRYLEDRGILSKDYFTEIATTNASWEKILEAEDSKQYVDSEMRKLLFPKILTNKKFTYALFKQIAKDFNGDIFPTDDLEENEVTLAHLKILGNFLDGNVINEPTLFFWAYRFDIIPIELISNIYEEFYHYKSNEDNGKDNKGTFYTPAPLVEFVLRRTLTEDVLIKKPVIIDPACGSGIFLVEAFRRMVRFELYTKKKKKLSYSELLYILQNQIRGIELNEEAIKITAFSLYLAFLDCQAPPDILLQLRKGKKLPHLIYSNTNKPEEEYFDILLQSNAFKVNEITSEIILTKFQSNCADIIIGNPPWGSPSKEDAEGREALEAAIIWCEQKGYPLSDMERSQAFIWRAIDLLRPGGTAGLLVSSGVLLKQSDKSNDFKREWLETISLREIGNFIHVRDVFFNGAISPFFSIVFDNLPPKQDDYINYWTARRTKIIEHTKAVILDKTDFKFLTVSETQTTDIWKIFYFGNHQDLFLINKIRLNTKLEELEYTPEDGRARRQGFIEGNKKLQAGWLKGYKELPARCFDDRYSAIPYSRVLIDVPAKVKERGAEYIFFGERLLIGKVSQKTNPKGQLIARLENKKFSFRNTINCVKLKKEYKTNYKTILGILWSSLSRYYFFMTSSKWGVWHDQIYSDEILNLPIRLPKKQNKLQTKISNVVDQLRNEEFNDDSASGQQQTLFDPNPVTQKYTVTKTQLEKELDQHIFNLYNLTEAEIDLINERCELDIDHFYKGSNSIAVAELDKIYTLAGDAETLQKKRTRQNLDNYILSFLNRWNPELENHQTLKYKIIYPPSSPLIAIVFYTKKVDYYAEVTSDVVDEWGSVLKSLDKELQTNHSSKIYIDGVVRVYSDDLLIIIKRNEQRLWTRTSGREDAEATILQAMIKQETSHA